MTTTFIGLTWLDVVTREAWIASSRSCVAATSARPRRVPFQTVPP